MPSHIEIINYLRKYLYRRFEDPFIFLSNIEIWPVQKHFRHLSTADPNRRIYLAARKFKIGEFDFPLSLSNSVFVRFRALWDVGFLFRDFSRTDQAICIDIRLDRGGFLVWVASKFLNPRRKEFGSQVISKATLCIFGRYKEASPFWNTPYQNPFLNDHHFQLFLHIPRSSSFSKTQSTPSPMDRSCLDFTKSPTSISQTHPLLSNWNLDQPHFPQQTNSSWYQPTQQ